VGFLKSPI